MLKTSASSVIPSQYLKNYFASLKSHHHHHCCQRRLLRTTTTTTTTTTTHTKPLTSSFLPQRHKKSWITTLLLVSSITTAIIYQNQQQQSNMSSTLVPSNPEDVMVIRDITPNVVTFSVPFLRFGCIPIGGRGTVVKLSSGSIAVFSPVALTASAKAKIASLGNDVRYLVATDIEHHIFLSEWKTAYPNAKLIGPEGLQEKRAKVTDDPRIGHEEFAVVFTKENKLTLKVDKDFDRDFEYEYVDGHANKELVFHYKPDRVLIEADLMFNLPAIEQYSKVPEKEKPKPGFLGNFMMGLQSTQGDAKGMKRFMWYVASKDRASFNESVKRIDAWGFDNIVPCHGETIVGGGKEVFEKVFEWHLTGKK
ncbi:hypothetical protein QBC38DRAFT_470774 [Podospora fimiseda]|uniref:Uncharacterized protein n=1 Tax=Podospora fimiseda TaxID=252190 RepID=A0AAN7BUN2_9PEZI|nr:hypothetical protein QBC38DRAFT_470774 [Podospora fimiseda]